MRIHNLLNVVLHTVWGNVLMINNEFENFNISMGLYKKSTTPIVFLDADMYVIWANEKAVERFPSVKQADGLTLYISLEQKNNLKQTMKDGKTAVISSVNAPLSDLNLMMMPIFEENGEYFVICHLINSKTKQSTIDSKNFMSILSSQIREPLFYIFSSSTYIKRLLNENNLNDGDLFMDSITNNSYKILRSATMMAMYARYIDGTSSFSPATVDIYRFLYEICDSVDVLTGSSEIPFTYDIPQKIVYAAISADKLTTAVLNIIYNSFLYTAPGNKISVSAKENKSYITITIRDKGMGMTTEQLENVFLPMTSFSTDVQAVPNMGLGLTLSKMIINEHGGTVAITSAPRVGTTIAFNIPIVKKEMDVITLNQTAANYLSDTFSLLYVNMIGFKNKK